MRMMITRSLKIGAGNYEKDMKIITTMPWKQRKQRNMILTVWTNTVDNKDNDDLNLDESVNFATNGEN
jgi:hypothetical protein